VITTFGGKGGGIVRRGQFVTGCVSWSIGMTLYAAVYLLGTASAPLGAALVIASRSTSA
jgi:hypothetical protein